MPQSVNLADEFALPDTAPEQPPAASFDVSQEFDPPPARETEAVVVDAHRKITDWKKSFREADGASARFNLLKQWAGEKAADAFKTNAKEVFTEANTSLIPEGAIPRSTAARFEDPEINATSSVLSGAYNTAAKFAEGQATPFNIATLGTFGALTKLAGGVGPAATAAKAALPALKVAFGAQIAKGAGEETAQAVATLEDPNATDQQKVEAVLAPLVTGGMAILSAASGVSDVRGMAGERRGAANPNAVTEKIASAPERAAEIADTNKIIPEPGPETKKLSSTESGAQKLSDIQEALKSPDTVIQ